jgi:hypothetical protein
MTELFCVLTLCALIGSYQHLRGTYRIIFWTDDIISETLISTYNFGWRHKPQEKNYLGFILERQLNNSRLKANLFFFSAQITSSICFVCKVMLVY